MKALLDAIKVKFDASGALHGSVTDMFLTVAPQGTTFPYIVYSIVSSNPMWVFPAKAMEDVMIQFSIFSENTSAVQANTIYGLLTAVFDWSTLAIAGHTLVMLKREVANLLLEDEKFWHYAVSYRVLFQKT